MSFQVHPRHPIHICEKPRWRTRRHLGVREGTIITCLDCKQRWQWQRRGVTDLAFGWVPVTGGAERQA